MLFLNGLAIQVYSTRAAQRDTAVKFGTGRAQLITYGPQQRRDCLGIDLHGAATDMEFCRYRDILFLGLQVMHRRLCYDYSG